MNHTKLFGFFVLAIYPISIVAAIGIAPPLIDTEFKVKSQPNPQNPPHTKDPDVHQLVQGNAHKLKCQGKVLNKNNKAIYSCDKFEISSEVLQSTELQVFMGTKFCSSYEELHGPKKKEEEDKPTLQNRPNVKKDEDEGLIFDHFLPVADSLCEQHCLHQAWQAYDNKKSELLEKGHFEKLEDFHTFIEENEPAYSESIADILKDKNGKTAELILTGLPCAPQNPFPLDFPLHEEATNEDENISLLIEPMLEPLDEVVDFTESVYISVPYLDYY